MAPVPPYSTTSYRVSYTGPLGSHNCVFHGQPGVTDAELRGYVAQVVGLAVNLQYDNTNWHSGAIRQVGSNLWITDSAWTPIIADNAAGVPTEASPAAYVGFVGLGITTHVRVRFFLFETPISTDRTMRINPGANANVDAMVALLNDVDVELCSADGDLAAWKPYANVKTNDFITKRVRRT